MPGLFNYWVLQTLAMCLTIFLIPKLKVTSILGPIGAVVVLAFVNTQVWDAALFFRIPNHFSMHALLLLVTNGLIFWIVVKLLPGIEIEGFLPALFAPVVFTACSLVIHVYGKSIDWNYVFGVFMEMMTDLKDYFFENIGSNPKPLPEAS